VSAPSTLIINTPFTELAQHWTERSDRTLGLGEGRRPAGYEIIDTRETTRRQVQIPLADDIRQRLAQWRNAGWPGVTAVTQQLLTHWWYLLPVGQASRPSRSSYSPIGGIWSRSRGGNIRFTFARWKPFRP